MSSVTLATRTLAAALAILGQPAPAEACGSFRVVDPELGQTIAFLTSSVRIPRNPDDLVLLRLDGNLPEQLRTIDRGRPQLWFEGTKLRLHGREVGELVGPRFKVGANEYVVEVGPASDGGPAPEGGAPARRTLSVSRAGRTILIGTARGLCLGGAKPTAMAEETEIRRRVVYYLAWRHLLVPQALRPQPAAVKERLARELAREWKRLERCHHRAMREGGPQVEGTVEVDVVLTADGAVREARVRQNRARSKPLAACVLDVIRKVNVGTVFDVVKLTHSLEFRRGE